MSIATANFTPSASRSPKLNPHRPSPFSPPPTLLHLHFTTTTTLLSLRHHSRRILPVLTFSGGGGNGGISGGGTGGGGNGDGDGNENENERILALAKIGRSLDSLPNDLAKAIESGRIPGSIVERYLELEKSGLFRWLLQFGGFRERLLADDLFLAKVAMECGVGIFTKTAAEYERRRENFFNELEIVFADVVMAIIADFMLVWLPAPTVSLRPAISLSAGPIAKFFYGCPDNAFQVGTVVTNALINARKAVDKSAAEEVENVPILSTSAAYGVYMAVSSNLRYVILDQCKILHIFRCLIVD
ncbi:hypothetical protein LguiB_032376 [Lonicera macranthoides]